MCPYYKNKEVFDDFNEIVVALGGKPMTEEEFKSKELRHKREGVNYAAMEGAYRLWHFNNGNKLDYAPNGALSKLFSDLLKLTGDRAEAIRLKSEVYSDEFKNWFGDWISDSENVSKVVDENGEPMVVYHGTNDYGFSRFDPLKSDDKKSLFFSSSMYIASTYTNFLPLSNLLIRKRLIDNNAIDLIKNKKYKDLEKLIKETIDYSLHIPNKRVQDDPRYDYSLGAEILKLREEFNSGNVSHEKAQLLLADIQKLEDLMWLSGNYRIYIREHPANNQSDPIITIKIVDVLKNIYDSSFWTEGGIIFNGTSEQLIDAIQNDTKVYCLFLNIKNPMVLDNQSNEFGASNFWHSVVYNGKQYKTRDISKIAEENGYDGVIFEDVVDHGPYRGYHNLNPVTDNDIAYAYLHEDEDSYTGTNVYSSNIYIAYLSNLVRPATKNPLKTPYQPPTTSVGEFSTQNDLMSQDDENIIRNAVEKVSLGRPFTVYTADGKTKVQFSSQSRNHLSTTVKNALKQVGFRLGKIVYAGNKVRAEVSRIVSKNNKQESTKQEPTRIQFYKGDVPLLEQEEYEYRQFEKYYESPTTRVSEFTAEGDLMASSTTSGVYQTPTVEPITEEELLQKSITRRIYNLGVSIDEERRRYINSVVDQYKTNNPEVSSQEISRVFNQSRKQFDIDKSNQLIAQQLIVLAQSFGMTMNRNGFYESSESSQKKLMLEFFINSLQESTFRAYNLENLNRTKYQQVGNIQSSSSIGNVIYSALYNGDLVTLDKELARDYIRMFWGSDLIQSALNSLDTGNKTPQQLEDELVDKITRNPVQRRNRSLVEWFNNFWNNLQNIIKTVFSDHSFSDLEKSDIITATEAAYTLSEDLEYTSNNDVIYDREDGNYNSSIMLSEADKQAMSNIKQGIKTRIKSHQSRVSKNQRMIADLKTKLEIINSKNEDSIDDVFDIIQDFLVTANNEIGKTRNYIDRTLLFQLTMDNWDPQQINFIQLDLIGYYKNLLGVISRLFSDKNSSINKMNEYRVQNNNLSINLKNLSNELVLSIEKLLEDYNSFVVKPYVRKVLTDFVNNEDSITDKKTFIYNMERWLEQDSSYGDLAFAEVYIGMASRSKSPIVRIVEKFASEADFKTGREVLKKGHELIRLYNKIRPTGSQISLYNWQRRFMEFDKDGISTGYFIRDINYGQFYKDKDAEEDRLRAKYNLDVDDDGNTIFPEEDFVSPNSVYNKYNDELDKWLDEHCERRYTLDYYRQRRRFLSPKTIQALNQIQRQIDLILDKCKDEAGFVDLSKLTQNERRQLDILRKLKRNLGSHYIFTEQNGVLQVEEKIGDALKMADEISAWNKYISDRVKYKPDWTKFNQAKQALVDKYGEDSQEVRAFMRNNTTLRITPEFYDLLHEAVGTAATTKELEDLKKRHSEIINAIKERPGAGSHNLNKLGLGLNTDQSGWRELLRIELRMADIRRDLIQRGIKGTAPQNDSIDFRNIAKMLYVTVGDGQSKSYLEYLSGQWRQAMASNTDLNNVFNELFTYRDEKGTIRFLKAFLYLTPLDWTLTIDGRTINCIESLPGSEYSELDESSPFVNSKFKKNGLSMQAKAYDENGNVLYKNKAYDDLSDNEMEFLNALLKTMDEANDMIPQKATSRQHLLPLISGRTMSVLGNTLRNKEWLTALKYTVRKFGVKYAETTEDVSTNRDLARRPDGTVVNNIPIRFINKLDNPAVLTTDVLGSVIMFYDMACNYKNKSKNLPILELIKYSITPDTLSANKMEDQYAKVENILDQRYYGKETSFGFDSDEKITDSKQQVIQATKTIRNMAAVAMLGVNFTTIEVGYMDAMLSMLCDAIAGKYITLDDMRFAFANCIVHTRKTLQGLGKQVVDDKLVAAMLYNQLSRSNSEIFSATDKFKLDRFVHDHLLMGGYTLTDYMVNSMMLMSTYHHYRLILDPKTNKKRFYSKSDAINEFTKLGYTEKQAINMWKKAETTLWQAYDCVDGDFVLKDEYKDIVTDKLENRIAGRLRDRTAMYNGIIPMSEKAKIQQNVFGSFLTLMRNFYVNTYWDRFKTGGDYVTEGGDHHIEWKSEFKRDDLGMVNLETGEFEGAVFKDFCRGMYKLTMNTKRAILGQEINSLTRELKYALTRSAWELIIIGGLLFSMLWSIAFARANNYDDDKDPAWTLELFGENKGLHFKTQNMDDKFMDWMRWKLALLATRGFTERLTPWTPQVAFELFTSPTVATSYLDDVGQMWGLATDLFSQRTDEIIKQGGYKHMTRGTRDILKIFSAFGVDNIVRSWHTDGIKSTFNYYRQLKPTSAFVPSQTEWNEQHGLGKHGGKKKSKKKSNIGEFVY